MLHWESVFFHPSFVPKIAVKGFVLLAAAAGPSREYLLQPEHSGCDPLIVGFGFETHESDHVRSP